MHSPTCERCGTAIGVRTYFAGGPKRTEHLCRPCSERAAYEAAEAQRNAWARAEAGRLVALGLATPDDYAPGADAHDRYFDR